jgi:hypothetical protein
MMGGFTPVQRHSSFAPTERHGSLTPTERRGSFTPIERRGLNLERGVGNRGTVRSISTVSSTRSSPALDYGMNYWERYREGGWDIDSDRDQSLVRSGRASSVLDPGLIEL